MGKFNLNNAADFARATDSFGAGILQTFTGRGNSDWIIEECSYKSGINPDNIARFHIFRTATDYDGALASISDSGGRRLAKFQFAYMDGQVTEDMGRKAETFSLDIVLHGNNYLTAFVQMMQILNEPVPGTLIHPVRGEIVCKMETYELVHQSTERKAVAIKLVFEEHSFDAIALPNLPETSAPSLLSKLGQAFNKIENAINAVQGTVLLVQSVKNQIKAGIQAYQQAFSKISGNMNATFNPGNRIPAISPTQSGGVLNGSGQVVSNSVSVAASPDDPLQSVPQSVLSSQTLAAVAVDQLFKDINTARGLLGDAIQSMEAAADGRGAQEFFDNIMDLRTTAVDLQNAFEAGKKSSQANVTKYVTPTVMSVREVAFANGLGPDDGIQVMYLNPELDSANFIPKGTTLNVAVK